MTTPSTIQSVAWETGLLAIRDSAVYTDFDAFGLHLRNSIPQNSEATRKRYAAIILKRLFPEHSLQGLNPRAWRIYQDETILVDLARVTTLEAEPVIANFVVQNLLTIPPGNKVDIATLRDYISALYGTFKRDTYTRLLSALGHMGFVDWADKDLIAQAFPRPTNAFLILLHARLAPTPRIVRLEDVLMPPATEKAAPAPFWKLLGMRDPADVRAILRDAEAAGLIAKYAVVDQLEQITTRYSLDQYFEGKHRL